MPSFLAGLESKDFLRREGSRVRTGDAIWVFTPWVTALSSFGEWETFRLWIRLLERDGFWVVSVHEG